MKKKMIKFNLRDWIDKYRVKVIAVERYLKISHQTIYTWMDRGEVPEWAYKKLKKAEKELRKREKKRYQDFLPDEG